jgi:hypothetical protein
LCRWGIAEHADVVELLTSELVTNAVRAARGVEPDRSAWSAAPLVRLWLRLVGDTLLIEAWDPGAACPVLSRPTASAENGRGLQLVDAMSDRWDHYTAWPCGKVVWCAVDVPSPDPTPPELPLRTPHPLRSAGSFHGLGGTAERDPRLLRRVRDGLRGLG